MLPQATLRERVSRPQDGCPFGGSSESDVGGSIVSYAWTLTDGGGIVTGLPPAAGAVVTLTPSAAGRFSVSLTITDELGATSTTSLSVDVAAAPPPVEPPPSSDGGGGGGAVGGLWLLLLAAAVRVVRRSGAAEQ